MSHPAFARTALLATPLAVAALAFATPAIAKEEPTSEARLIFDARYRFEHVDPDNALRTADANTLRTRIGFQTATWSGWSGLAELDNVTHLGPSHFNSTRNDRTGYATVADPDGTEVNQALVRYRASQGGVTLGRQRINLDNQRMVGGVAWRQNEQTYDGALFQYTPTDRISLTYAFIDNINSVFGPDDDGANRTNPADFEGDSHLFNAQAKLFPALTLTAYQYRLDLQNVAVTPTAPLGTLSSATTGLRATGTHGAWSYALEFARQRDIADNPWHLDSRYALAELGYRIDKVQLKAGYERLGAGDGPGNRAFQTPLATKHAFQGWADLFLTTPADGIEDRYVGVTAPLFGGTAQAWYHDFIADRGGIDYGRELDLSYAHAIPHAKGLTGLLKLAHYRTDAPALTVDTDKAWVQLQYTY